MMLSKWMDHEQNVGAENLGFLIEKPETRFEVPPITYLYAFLNRHGYQKLVVFFWNENFKSKESMAFPNDGESTTLIPPGICEQKCLPSTFAYKRSFTMRCFRFPFKT